MPHNGLNLEVAQRIAFGDVTARAAGAFDYDVAFSRNIGWLTRTDQQILRNRRVAIAGLGGVGGVHALTLARLGVGAFHLADFDHFDWPNMNRQAGAFADTIGRAKCDVMAEMLSQVNPTAEITTFSEGISDSNTVPFLKGVDLFVDGLDFFVLDLRRALFAEARAAGVPAITLAPLGMGVAWLTFLPDGMSFEDYFRFEDGDEAGNQLRFLLGLAPRMLQLGALADPSAVRFSDRAAPSTPMACQMCAGIAGVETVRMLTGRGGVRAAPRYQQFDPYRGKFVTGRLWGGNAHPLQRLKLAYARRLIRRFGQTKPSPVPPPQHQLTPIRRVLDVARWAPSGDNTQPWTFRICSDTEAEITVAIETDNPYEFEHGRPTVLSAGMLLESARIAASQIAYRAEWDILEEGPQGLRFRLVLKPDPDVTPDELHHFITTRSVERSAYRRTPLPAAAKEALSETLGRNLTVRWYEDMAKKVRLSLLNARATRLRLRLKETERVHHAVIDADDEHSPNGIPVGALGLGAVTEKIFRWAVRSPRRMRLVNRHLRGWIPAALELDILPGMRSAAHFSIHWSARDRHLGTREVVEAGQSLQRFWLMAESLGLVLQPAFAPICFASHAESGHVPTAERNALKAAQRLARGFRESIEDRPMHVAFMGRIGYPRFGRTRTRSYRRDLDRLITADRTEAREESLREPVKCVS